MLTCCALFLCVCYGGLIALNDWAGQSHDDASCLIKSSFWRSIVSLRCCSSNSKIPIPSNWVKCVGTLDIASVRSIYLT